MPGHGGTFERSDDGANFYLTMSLRNGGAGVAVIQAWGVFVGQTAALAEVPDVDGFRPQLRDMYVPAGEAGFWQGAIRGRDDPHHAILTDALARNDTVMVDLLYGDYEGGQRTVTRFRLYSPADDNQRVEVLRVWVLDGIDPRSRARD